jgi:hypothetical protein
MRTLVHTTAHQYRRHYTHCRLIFTYIASTRMETDKNKQQLNRQFMNLAFHVEWCDGVPSPPQVAKTSKVLTEEVYDKRIKLLEKWNSMPVATKKQRATRLAFKQEHRQGYRLDKLYKVATGSEEGTKVLKRRPEENACLDNSPWGCQERGVCHANNVFDIIHTFHCDTHQGLNELMTITRNSWSNVPRKLCEIYLSICPVCASIPVSNKKRRL